MSTSKRGRAASVNEVRVHYCPLGSQVATPPPSHSGAPLQFMIQYVDLDLNFVMKNLRSFTFVLLPLHRTIAHQAHRFVPHPPHMTGRGLA